MNIDDGYFKTSFDNNTFTIETSKEGDCSYDGGYSFELVECNVELLFKQAQELRNELDSFLSQAIINKS